MPTFRDAIFGPDFDSGPQTRSFDESIFDADVFETSPTAAAFQPSAFQNNAFQIGIYASLIDQTATTFAPTISTFGVQDIAPGLINSAATTFAPQLNLTIFPNFIDQTASTFAPSVSSVVNFGLISQPAVAYAPTLLYNQTVDLGLIDQTAVVYAFAGIGIRQDVTVGLIDQTATIHSPTITKPITFLGSTESIRTSTLTPWNFTSSGAGASGATGTNYQTGVLVSAVMTGSGGNLITGITCGGKAMTEIVTSSDTTGEPGFSSLWFCVPDTRGDKTITVTLSSATGNDFQFVAMEFTSEFDIQVLDSDSISVDTDDPSVVLSTGGTESLAVVAMFSGLDAPSSISELGTMTLVQDHDFGTTSAEVARQTTRGTTDFTAGFTTTASDDVALVAALLAQTDDRTIGFFDRINQTAVAYAPIIGRYPRAVIDDGPVAYWRLGESSGTTAADSWDSHPGFYENTPTLGVTGALTNDSDKAVTLNGINEFISVNDHADFDFEGDFTFEAWVKHNGTFGTFHDALIGKGAGNNPFWWIAPDGDMVLRDGSLSTNISRTVSPVITDTNWHYLVVTYEDGVACRMYKDGAELEVDGFNDATFVAGSGKLGIGSGWGTVWSDGWHGSLDEVAIYNYVLTPEQIAAHYAAGIDTDVLLPRINQTASTFTPSITGGNLTVEVARIDQTAQIHTPTVTPGAVNISPGLIDQTAAAYAPQVNRDLQEIILATINQAAAAYAPSVEWDKYIFIDRIDRRAIPFNPTVTGGFIYTPPTGGGPGGGPADSLVVIRYDGVDITDDVVIVGATFTSQANGTPGTCNFKIKDPGHTYSLTTGKRLTLDINSQRVWTGYVSKVSRVYAFKAQDTSNPSLVTRFLEVDGSDINILFRKRIVFEKANPKRLAGRTYTADNTDDTVAYFDLVEDFLDLSDDNLDVSTMIENVGTINVDHPANPIAPGHPWGDSMRSIIALSNGVFYIDPDRRVVLTDVDTPSAPFDLSDDPADNAVGYRDMEVLYNASNMINDCIVWGAGGGSGTMVYSREEDATSIATHGRWQYGEFRGDMYKQGTVNRRADSIVQGSAQSKRGAKDDQVSVICTVFEPGLRVAQKIDFTSAAFGFNDVLPIRRMTVTFVGPTKPKYQIMAGHEIDMPWGFFDIWRPKIDWRVFNADVPTIDIDIPCIDCDGCDCERGITDTFGRTVTGGFGVSDAGIPWTTDPVTATVSFDVAGGLGYIFNAGSASSTTATAIMGTAGVPNEYTTDWDPTTVKTMRFQWVNVDPIYSTDYFHINWGLFRTVGQPVPSIVYRGDTGGGSGGTTGSWHIRTTGGLTDGTLIPDGFFVDGTTYTWTCYDSGGTFYTSVTDGVDTYTISQGYTDDQLMRCSVSFTSSLQSPFVETDRSFVILDIDIPEIAACTDTPTPEVLDSFTRTVGEGSGWGTSDSGRSWSDHFGGSLDGLGVNGTKGFMHWLSGQGVNPNPNIWFGFPNEGDSSGPWNTESGWEMTVTVSWTVAPDSNGAPNAYMEFVVGVGNVGFVRCAVGVTDDATYDPILFVDDDDGNNLSTATLPLVPNTDYYLKWGWQPGFTRAKIWAVGDTEPGWQVAGGALTTMQPTGNPAIYDHSVFEIRGSYNDRYLGIGGTPRDRYYYFDNLSFGAQDCIRIDTLPGSGRVCQDFVGDGFTTDFYTTQTQTYGQTSVTLDGFHQTLQQYDQIANDDGNLTGVSLLVAPAEGVVVRVCYNVGEGINAGSTPL